MTPDPERDLSREQAREDMEAAGIDPVDVPSRAALRRLRLAALDLMLATLLYSHALWLNGGTV